MEINSNHSTYGAAFRQKPIFFMSGKETVAYFERGKHTTRHSQIIPIAENTYIMDTPGFSSMDLPGFSKEDLWNKPCRCRKKKRKAAIPGERWTIFSTSMV